MLVHWFNPDNDLALASGVARYTPVRAALELRRAGECLPLWYAAPGDRVLTHGVPAAWFDSIASLLDNVDIFDHQVSDQTVPSPWGWSAAARTYLHDEGFPLDLLPDDDAISAMRMLSHRRTSIVVAQALHERLPGVKLAAPAVEATDIESVTDIIDRRPQTCLKAPWSSSGRGVVMVTDVGRDRALRFAADTIRSQGSVMVERAYPKKMDFARIFRSEDSGVHCLGTSVFATDKRGAYTGNLLASESARLARVGQVCDLADLDAVTEALQAILTEMAAPVYRGILGVDMLVAEDGTLDAVVEINLRKTMGYVAMQIADLHMVDGAEGIFSVTPLRGTGAPADTWTSEDGRLVSGTINLVPPSSQFAMTADIGSVG